MKTRRQFLRHAGLAFIAPSAFVGATQQRSLSMVHTHTGEKLMTPYLQSGTYAPRALTAVNHFLRDFRTGDSHPIDPGLLDILYLLQERADRADVFEIISAYRSPQTNSGLRAKSGGVAEHSLHMRGMALDIRLAGFPTRKLRDYALDLKTGGVGYYARSDFLHVDTGRVRFW